MTSPLRLSIRYRVTTPMIILRESGRTLLVKEGAKRLDEEKLLAEVMDALRIDEGSSQQSK